MAPIFYSKRKTVHIRCTVIRMACSTHSFHSTVQPEYIVTLLARQLEWASWQTTSPTPASPPRASILCPSFDSGVFFCFLPLRFQCSILNERKCFVRYCLNERKSVCVCFSFLLSIYDC